VYKPCVKVSSQESRLLSIEANPEYCPWPAHIISQVAVMVSEAAPPRRMLSLALGDRFSVDGLIPGARHWL